LYNKSRVMGDYQARFCERLEGKFLRPTRRVPRSRTSAGNSFCML